MNWLSQPSRKAILIAAHVSLYLICVPFQNQVNALAAKNGDLTKANKPAKQSSDHSHQKKAIDAIGVDWSSWVSQLADCWYEKLLALEKQSGKHFRTLRPARIKFTCYADGTIGQISIYRSCGIAAYDKMQIEALKQTAPLSAFPAGSKRKSRTLLQGWESHPRVPGEPEFKPGSYGKYFPVEKVRPKSKVNHP